MAAARLGIRLLEAPVVQRFELVLRDHHLQPFHTLGALPGHLSHSIVDWWRNQIPNAFYTDFSGKVTYSKSAGCAIDAYGVGLVS